MVFVPSNRKNTESKEIDIELKNNYAELCEKSERGGIGGDGGKSCSDKSNGNNLEAFDGFADGWNDLDISTVQEVWLHR